MNRFIQNNLKKLNGIQAILSVAVIVLSFITIFGWIRGNELLTTLGAGYIPMAPSTAILFIIVSLSFLGVSFGRTSSLAGILYLSGGIIIFAFSFPMLVLSFFNIHPAFQSLGFGGPGETGSPMVGHMSPVTSFLFTILGGTLVMNKLVKKDLISTWIMPILPMIVLLVGLILLGGYVIGHPLLYGNENIPVALNTSICFVLLGINVTIESSIRVFSNVDGEESGFNRSVHLYSLVLSVIITGILFFGYLNVQTIFKNIQEEVKNKMFLVAELRGAQLEQVIKDGGDPAEYTRYLTWPLNEDPSSKIEVFLDNENFPGWRGQEEFTEYENASGQKIEVCFNRIEGSQWVLACLIEKQVAFKPIIQQFIQVTILITCLLILTVTTLILISRQSKLRVYKEQADSAEKLRMAEDQFRNAFEHSSVGKTMIYMDGSFHVNKAFAEMLGYKVDELNQMTWKDITMAEDEEISLAEMNLLLEGKKESTRFEKRYYHKNGDIIWIDLQSYLQRDKEGNPLYFITSASNISDYKKLQAQLIRSKEEAEKSNKLKDAFIANISHEIRTPLNAILGFTDLVRDELAEKNISDFDNYFDIIRTSGSRLTRTVDMILNVSRLQVGEFEPQKVPIQIHSLIFDLFSEYKLAAQKKGIRMEFINKVGPAIVHGDEYCYTHSISNLIDNAVKYTQSGRIILTLYRNQVDSLCLDVEDTGVGISREFIEEIFNPFTQEDTSTTRKFEGIGLGLSIAQRLLVLTKASITVKSEKGEGTIFTITF